MSNDRGRTEHDDGLYRGEDRRRSHELSARQLDQLAEKIAEIAAPKAALLAKQMVIDEFAMTIGRSVISKIVWAVGIAFIAVALWLAGTGHLKP